MANYAQKPQTLTSWLKGLAGNSHSLAFKLTNGDTRTLYPPYTYGDQFIAGANGSQIEEDAPHNVTAIPFSAIAMVTGQRR